jgi:pyruvate dehydrogenase E1 component
MHAGGGVQETGDVFQSQKVPSMNKWAPGHKGQHVPLGIAENNFFLAMTAFGMSAQHFGHRLFPVGTLYDPFIARGLDALNYGCYQDARFMLVATPSGITLAPEGGAHQSINTPLIGMSQPGLASYEPAYADELLEVMQWGFNYMQAPQGGSVYLRLSTRTLAQPRRDITPELRDAILRGAYWHAPPTRDTRAVIAFCGVVAPEAAEAHRRLVAEHGEHAVALLQACRVCRVKARATQARAGAGARRY